MTTAHTYRGTERSLEPGTPDWTGAACIPPDDDLFFVDDYSGTAAIAATEEAKRICNELCGLRDQCLDWALTHPHLTQYGVFGGQTADERNAHAGRHCEQCGEPFQAARNSHALYCPDCRTIRRRQRHNAYDAKRPPRNGGKT